MSSVRSLGSTEDVAAFEADYDGPVTRMEAVSQALKGIGASLVSTGDREFYLAIQGPVRQLRGREEHGEKGSHGRSEMPGRPLP